MDFQLHLQILRKRVQVFFLQARKLFFFLEMAFINLLNSRGGPQSFDFDITYFISNQSYPLLIDLSE